MLAMPDQRVAGRANNEMLFRRERLSTQDVALVSG
jgi:hypothetical protein